MLNVPGCNVLQNFKLRIFFYIDKWPEVLIASSPYLSRWLLRQKRAVPNIHFAQIRTRCTVSWGQYWTSDDSNHCCCAAHVLGVVVLFLIGIVCVMC